MYFIYICIIVLLNSIQYKTTYIYKNICILYIIYNSIIEYHTIPPFLLSFCISIILFSTNRLIFFFFNLFLFIYCWLCWVFVAVRGLFSSCGDWGLLFVATCGLLLAVASFVLEHELQVRGLQQLWHVGSGAQTQQLWHKGLVAPQHVGSYRTRARTHVPCIGRRILNHCTTREVPD